MHGATMATRELLVTDVRAGEALDMEILHQDGTKEVVRIRLVHKSGRIARLSIDAPDSVRIPRALGAKDSARG
jgi:hypothetical protein